MADEWERLAARGESQRVFVLSRFGDPSGVDPRVMSPRAWCLYWYMMTDLEKARTLDALRHADVVVVPKTWGHWHHAGPDRGDSLVRELVENPGAAELAAAISELSIAEDGRFFRVYLRRPLPR